MLHASSEKADRRFLIPICLPLLAAAMCCERASADEELIRSVLQDPAESSRSG